MTKHGDCSQIRERLEAEFSSEGSVGSEPMVQRHLDSCAACREAFELRTWSRRVLQAGDVQAQPPLMSAVWASIHRASEQAWDSALSRSFRYLLPYMVAVVALILLVGGLTSSRTATPVKAASTAYSWLSSPEVPPVAGIMTSADQPTVDAAQVLGDVRPAN